MDYRSVVVLPLVAVLLLVGLVACSTDASSDSRPTPEQLKGSSHPALSETVVASGDDGGHPPHGAMPPGHPPISGGGDTAGPLSEGPPAAPSGALTIAGMVATPAPDWVSEPPASRMRAAQYRLPHAEGDEFDGELTVIAIPGGDLEGNIRRWQGEFQSPPEPKIDNKTVNGIEVTIVDLQGTFLYKASSGGSAVEPREGYRVLVATARAPEQQVFFKAFGPAATINRWEPAFYEMVESFRPTR